jgi:hypothetical protein
MANIFKEGVTADRRGSHENIFVEKRPEPVEKSKKAVFYSLLKKQAFRIPIKDQNGKVVPLMVPNTNMPRYLNGRPVPMLRDVDFTTLSDNVKKGCLSIYQTDDEDEIKVLNELSADDQTKIMTEEQYKNLVFPETNKLQKELKSKEVEIENIKSYSEKQADTIAKLEAEIEALTKPKAK